MRISDWSSDVCSSDLQGPVEGGSKLFGKGAECRSLLFELCQLIARDPLRRQIGHSMLEFVTQHGQPIIDALAEAVVIGSKDDGSHDAPPRGPDLRSRYLHENIEPPLHRNDTPAAVECRASCDAATEAVHMAVANQKINKKT